MSFIAEGVQFVGPVKNLQLEQGATAAINAALTLLAQIGYDTTLQRAKIYDGSTVRQLLQLNDIVTGGLAAAATAGGNSLATASDIKAYVDGLVTSGQQAFQDFDASSATNLPSGATLASRYRVTVAGTVQGVPLQAMDAFYPRVASPSPTASGDWIFVQANVDLASTTAMGLVLLATLSQIQGNAAGDANRVVSVATLNAWEAALGRVRKFVATNVSVAVGSNNLVHGLGNNDVVPTFYTSSGDVIGGYTIGAGANVNTNTFTAAAARTGVKIIVVG